MNKRISKMQNKINKISKFIIFACAFLVTTVPFPKDLLANDFIQTFALRCGGSPITAEEAAILAKYDMSNVKRAHHDSVNGDTWSAIKAIAAFPTGYNMDVGSIKWINYWLEATEHDLVDQPWTADGVFIDVVNFHCRAMNTSPAKYNSANYAEAQHKFINKIAVGLGEKNQKIICNTALVDQTDFDNYVKLDNSYAPPYAMFVEGAFAVTWGTGDVQFYSEHRWKQQIDLLSQIHNFKLVYLSHTELKKGQSGTDNQGKPVTYHEILWYSMASYHLGKNTVEINSYWSFCDSRKYKVTTYGGKNIYWREFERGYIYVNPTKYSVSAISLPKKCKQLTRYNFKKDPATIASINTINLKGHRAAFLLKETYKETYDDDKPYIAPPSNLRVNP